MEELSNNYAVLEGELARWIASGGATAGFEEMILRVYRYQREAGGVYGAYCAGRPEARGWWEIPAVPVDAFRRAGIRSFPESRTARTFLTSGTTGEVRGEHHFCSLRLYLQVAVRGWISAGLPVRGVVALVPHPAEAPGSSLSQMAAWLAPREDFFFGRWEELRQRVVQDGPVVLFGTALAFLSWFEGLGEASVELSPGSVAVETGGYKGSRRTLAKAELYALFRDRLGLEPEAVWNEYGMTELSSQFYTRGLGGVHRGGFWVRALVVDPASGQEVAEGDAGVLRIFDAANLGSVCAIQTRDLAIRRAEGFELIGRDPAALPRGCSRGAEEGLE